MQQSEEEIALADRIRDFHAIPQDGSILAESFRLALALMELETEIDETLNQLSQTVNTDFTLSLMRNLRESGVQANLLGQRERGWCLLELAKYVRFRREEMGTNTRIDFPTFCSILCGLYSTQRGTFNPAFPSDPGLLSEEVVTLFDRFLGSLEQAAPLP